jgi:hypothetical protein
LLILISGSDFTQLTRNSKKNNDLLYFGYRRPQVIRRIGCQKAFNGNPNPWSGVNSGGWTVSERVAILEAIDKHAVGDNQYTGRQNFATQNQAAKQAGLGNKETARQTQKVVDDGSPELVEAVDSGEVSISAASNIVDLPRKSSLISEPQALLPSHLAGHR